MNHDSHRPLPKQVHMSVRRMLFIVLAFPAVLSILVGLFFDIISVRDSIQSRLTYSFPLPSSTTLSSPSTPAAADDMPTRHILFALSGNRSGFMSEFEVALKSVLLNAPPNNTTIHILANDPAYKALDTTVLHMAQLPDGWVSPFPIQIVVYNIQSQQDKWWDLIQKRMAAAERIKQSSSPLLRHTLGTYYRLLCGEVLAPTVDRVLYMDTDVVLLANPEPLWQQQRQTDETALFQWGKGQCAGFMLLRPHKMQDLWNLYARVPEKVVRQLVGEKDYFVDDQLVFTAVNQTFPAMVGTLPPEFDISAVNGPWMNHPKTLLKHRPDKAGMFHFNGGGTSKQAYFRTHTFLRRPLWGDMARYYVNLPWPWARFIVASSVKEGEGFRIDVQHRVV